MGNARRPGGYTISSLSTLVNALLVSGGPNESGSMRSVQVKRGGKVVTDFDLYDLLMKGDKTKDIRLMPEDVIFIPNVGPQVAFTGVLMAPGRRGFLEPRGLVLVGEIVAERVRTYWQNGQVRNWYEHRLSSWGRTSGRGVVAVMVEDPWYLQLEALVSPHTTFSSWEALQE